MPPLHALLEMPFKGAACDAASFMICASSNSVEEGAWG
jgi:hypothetical protein